MLFPSTVIAPHGKEAAVIYSLMDTFFFGVISEADANDVSLCFFFRTTTTNP